MKHILGAMLALCALAACDPPATATGPGPTPESAAPQSLVSFHDLPWRAATLSVGTTPQQRFEGFGFSFEHDNPYGLLSEERKAEVDRLLYDDLDTRIVRLWYAAGQPEVLRDDYLARGIIPHALAHGVTELLLAPAGSYPGDPDQYARSIAEDIKVMRDNYGIRITTTGVMNEPDAEDWKVIPTSDYVPLTIAMRRELDARGLEDVKIIGPEFASADHAPATWFDTIAADPAALASFDALGTHSYNMAATPEFAARTLAHDKQYWMTEAGAGNFDGSAEHDTTFPASISSRFLNDLNNGVTHWVWFIGLSHGTRDVYQKLLMCEGSCADNGRIYKNYGYHHVRQVATSFVPGTVMRHVTSDLPNFPDMVYSYGAKPALHAAAGIRPDGRWVLGVVNDTPGIVVQTARWDPPVNYRVTIEVPELAATPSLTFDLCRTNPEVAVQCGETIELTDGRTTIDVRSLELVTLVAQTPL
jgi:Glycosyl hydrolase catalytic core